MSRVGYIVRALFTVTLVAMAAKKAYLLVVAPEADIFFIGFLSFLIAMNLALAWFISPWTGWRSNV